jgi:hypothetical protein
MLKICQSPHTVRYLYGSRKSHYFRNTNNLPGHRDVDVLFPTKHKMNCIYNAAEFHAS